MKYLAVLTLSLLATVAAGDSADAAKGANAAVHGVSADKIIVGLEVRTASPTVNEESFGWQLAFRQANDRGGVHGRTVDWSASERKLVNRESGGTAEHLANARKAMDEDVFALVNFSGPAVVEIAALAKERKIPFLFPHSAMVDSRGNRYFFDSFPKYDGEARMMYRYLGKERGIRKIGIVHDQNKYGQDFADWLKQHASESGYEFVGNVPLRTQEPASLVAELQSLIDRGAEAVIMGLYVEQGRALMQAKAQLGWRGLMVSVGPLTDEQHLAMPGGAGEGTLGYCYYPDPANSDEPGVVAYRAAMQKYAPGRPYSRYTLYGYTFANLVLEGLRGAGRELTRERFIDSMEQIKGWDSGGIMPPVTLSPTDHHAQKAGFICELRDGRFRAISDWVVAQ